MKTVFNNYKGEELEVELYFTNEFKGKGGWNIKCEVTFNSGTKNFYHYITSAPWIDELSDLQSEDPTFEAIQEFYKKSYFENSFKEDIEDWCMELLEEEE